MSWFLSEHHINSYIYTFATTHPKFSVSPNFHPFVIGERIYSPFRKHRKTKTLSNALESSKCSNVNNDRIKFLKEMRIIFHARCNCIFEVGKRESKEWKWEKKEKTRKRHWIGSVDNSDSTFTLTHRIVYLNLYNTFSGHRPTLLERVKNASVRTRN